jgi:hypothetical protein
MVNGRSKTRVLLFGTFLFDLLLGASGFAAIAVAAVGIGKVVAWVETEQLPISIVVGLRGVEIAVFAVDIIGFLCYVVSSAYALIHDLFF